jgi:hypothetical protein
MTATSPVASTTLPRHWTGVAGLLSVTTLVAALAVAARPDLASDSELHAFLADNGPRLLAGWALTLLSGLAWLVLIAGLRSLLPPSPARDLFTLAAGVGQAATFLGASLIAASAPPGAREITLPVFTAFGEVAHLANASGTAATGLALFALASAAAASPLRPWPDVFIRVTRWTGAILIPTAVIGPVSLPAWALWTLATSLYLLRRAP